MGDYGIFTEGHAHSDGAEHDEPAVAVLEDSDGKIGRPSFGDLGPADSAWQRLADAVAEAALEHDRQTQPQFFNLSLAT